MEVLVILNAAKINVSFCNTNKKHRQAKENILNTYNTKKFNSVIFVNDNHQYDKDSFEFKFVPSHADSLEENLLDIDYLSSFKSYEFVEKDKMDWLHGSTASDILKKVGAKKVYVCGGIMSLDVLPTCLGMIDAKIEPILLKDCVYDVHDEINDLCINYLRFIGVNIYEEVRYNAIDKRVPIIESDRKDGQGSV